MDNIYLDYVNSESKYMYHYFDFYWLAFQILLFKARLFNKFDLEMVNT